MEFFIHRKGRLWREFLVLYSNNFGSSKLSVDWKASLNGIRCKGVLYTLQYEWGQAKVKKTTEFRKQLKKKRILHLTWSGQWVFSAGTSRQGCRRKKLLMSRKFINKKIYSVSHEINPEQIYWKNDVNTGFTTKTFTVHRSHHNDDITLFSNLSRKHYFKGGI